MTLSPGTKVQPKRSTLTSAAGLCAFCSSMLSERSHAAPVHRAQHLDVADGIEAEPCTCRTREAGPTTLPFVGPRRSTPTLVSVAHPGSTRRRPHRPLPARASCLPPASTIVPNDGTLPSSIGSYRLGPGPTGRGAPGQRRASAPSLVHCVLADSCVRAVPLSALSRIVRLRGSSIVSLGSSERSTPSCSRMRGLPCVRFFISPSPRRSLSRAWPSSPNLNYLPPAQLRPGRRRPYRHWTSMPAWMCRPFRRKRSLIHSSGRNAAPRPSGWDRRSQAAHVTACTIAQ
jgi:hypothetical protein